MSRKIHLDIDGMTCVNCQNKIERKLKLAEGVVDAPDGSINGCNYQMLIQDYGIEHRDDD